MSLGMATFSLSRTIQFLDRCGIRIYFYVDALICLQIMQDRACPGASEMYATASLIFPAIDGLLKALSTCSRLLRLEFDRNTTDKSQATIALLRPDCCVWLHGALVFKGEDKTTENGSLAVAIKELGDKMNAKWHPLTLGSLPYLLCYASCGPMLQFCTVMRDTNIAVPVSNVMNMNEVRSLWVDGISGRYCCCHSSWGLPFKFLTQYFY